MGKEITHGMIDIHSAPRALCPHIEWAASGILGVRIALDWAVQPAGYNVVRASWRWQAVQGTGARLASALRGWDRLRYDITEDASAGSDGGRWSHTPALGIFYAQTDVHGNIVVPEDRVKAAFIAGMNLTQMRAALDLALGSAWDEELEPFRQASEGAPVRWLHRAS